MTIQVVYKVSYQIEYQPAFHFDEESFSICNDILNMTGLSNLGI